MRCPAFLRHDLFLFVYCVSEHRRPTSNEIAVTSVGCCQIVTTHVAESDLQHRDAVRERCRAQLLFAILERLYSASPCRRSPQLVRQTCFRSGTGRCPMDFQRMKSSPGTQSDAHTQTS